MVTADVEQWEQEHSAEVAQQEYHPLVELARYSVLTGYVRHLAGHPSLLDLGCGDGLLRQRLQGVPFSRYLGLDFAPAAIERAKRLEDERTTFSVGSFPSPGETYDIVICNENLECIPDPGVFLDQVRQHVTPGGHLLVSVLRRPTHFVIHRLLAERFELVDALDVRNLTSWRSRRWRISCHRRMA
jgi:2-polyprenyl-6-hydroxyphenyl methylase/3-demethylubiquinone-9 3-methyltransferase